MRESNVSIEKSALKTDVLRIPITVDTSPSKMTAADLIKGTFDALSPENGAFENPLATWHRKFAEDSPDPVWSKMAEGQAGAYLTGVLGPEFELVGIKCGSQFCEIQAASTSSQDSEKTANTWQDKLSDMSHQSWWTSYGFASSNSAIWRVSDGRVLFVSYLTRGD